MCATGKSQTCTKGANGCLAWSAPADCAADQICCTTKCAPVDTTNCYACGAACSASAPRCLPKAKKCGCSVALCAAMSMGCSPTTGTCEACAPLAAGATDIFVDGTSFRSGTGTEACPFTTISAALAAVEAGSATARVNIHVAAGTYSAAKGETFPLVLRKKAIGILGAGAGKTIVRGSGSVDHSTEGGQLTGTYDVTFLVGDETAKHGIFDLTIRPENDMPTGGIGVLCDRGNAPSVIANPPSAPFPEPSLLLDKVTVGPGYDRGVIVTTTTIPAPLGGCNLMTTGSTFVQNAHGIWAVGAGLSAQPGLTVALRAGTKAAGTGNTFTKIDDGTNGGTSVEVWDAVSPVLLFGNTVTASNIGFALVNHGRSDVNIPIAPYVEIEGNTITNATNHGIALYNSIVVERLVDNTIAGVTAPAAAGYRGVGLIMDAGNANGNYVGIVKKARGNKIVGNDVGIEFRTKPFIGQPDGLKTDFGTAADPGKNTIGCNSTSTGSALIGYDIHVTVKGAGDGSDPTFAGNTWDHKPVSAITAASGTNGQDVLYTVTTSPPAFDLSNATLRVGACPAGRVIGP